METLARARHLANPDMQTKHAINALGSLAQETRLGIFRLLVQRGPDGVSAGDIADRLGVQPTTLSFHLTHLMRAGLIEQRRESRSLIYSANFACMHSLVSYLTENCCAEQNDCSGGTALVRSPPVEQPRARRATAK
jgi:ArsR family transcriptional regulator, arsenate/arsenite/antimonite-responsive transcriptional repressor